MQPSRGVRLALLVIGSAPTRRMYADYLGWRGVSVREVPSGEAALDHLTAFTPDAIVVEDRLQDGSGLDFTRTLRRMRSTALLPVVMLSSDVFGIDAARAAANGCDLLLTVPCLPEALFRALSELVERRATEPRQPPPDSWLFVCDDASVMILRTGDGTLAIYGPGQKRRTCTFDSELELVTFQVRFERRLVASGYLLEALRTDRRVTDDKERIPDGVDRRAVS
jgi:CheY-like chemotaxis protein